jgi:hypothetical protein
MAESSNLKNIDLEFETLRQFREIMASRLAYEGFFVATNTPLAKGTPARFRFLLPDGFVLVEGTAVVAWRRMEDEGPDLRAGMALLFNELEHQSREIIDELIDFHIATGGDPFDISAAISEAGDIGTDALAGDAEPMPVEPAVETVSEVVDPDDSKADGVLPDWLSEVAQKHDVDLSGDETVPAAEVAELADPAGVDEIPEIPDVPEIPEVSEIPDPSQVTEPIQTDFDISLLPEDEGAEATPLQAAPDSASDVTMPSRAKKPRKRFPLWLVLAAVVVIAGASAVAWWYVNRVPVPTAPPEPIVIADNEPVPEPQAEVAEPTAPQSEKPTTDRPKESTEEPFEDPSEVPESQPAIEQLAEVVERVSGPATRVLMIEASTVGSGTVITVRTNGELSEDTIRISPLKDPPRIWIRVLGIETFYRPNDIEVGSLEVERVRVGHHPEETPQSLYVVVDLESASANVREHSIEGDTLRVVVGLQ